MDIYRELGLATIINAAGTLTKLGGSLMPAEVVQAMVDASHDFVDMGELHLAAGRRIADLVGVEAAHVCAGATAGIALMAAACMTGSDRDKIDRLPDTAGMKSRFLVQRSHRQPYERAILYSGGKITEVAVDAGQLEQALTGDDVAGVFYSFAWFLREVALPLTEVAGLAHERGVPVIVDAAAEVPPVENLWRFVKEGADLVAFSGGKAIRGPQSTGFVVGRADLVEACRLNDNPYDAVGRSMKVCKEEIAGLIKALELYVHQDQQRQSLVWDQRVARMLEILSGVPGIRAVRQLPYGVGPRDRLREPGRGAAGGQALHRCAARPAHPLWWDRLWPRGDPRPSAHATRRRRCRRCREDLCAVEQQRELREALPRRLSNGSGWRLACYPSANHLHSNT